MSKEPAKTPPKPAAAPGKEVSRLTRDDWLDAAFKAVVEGGIDNMKVLMLAETLGVTRGSFYWHFEDHADLLNATLERWKKKEMETGLRLQAQVSPDPVQDMDQLLDEALAQGGADLENMRFELAVRGLGRRSPEVAQKLAEIDQVRMALFVQKFKRLIQDEQKANDLAALFYLAIVGCYQALSRPGTPERLKPYFKTIITTYLVQAQMTP